MPQHAAADAAVRLDADPGDPRAPQVQRHGLLADPGSGYGVNYQRRIIAGGQPELGPALGARKPGAGDGKQAARATPDAPKAASAKADAPASSVAREGRP